MRLGMSLREYFRDYKIMLEYIDKELTITTNFEDQKALEMIKDTIRAGFFRKYDQYIVHYFYPFDREFGHFEDAETFLYDGHTMAIRKFNGYYYAVKVKTFNSNILTTESPDDYPLHAMPTEGQPYPEYFIAEYLIEKGFGD